MTPRARLILIVTTLLGIGIGFAGVAVLSESDSPRGAVISPPLPIPNFTLTDQYNQPFEFAGLRGKWALVFFGYTYCPDVCPAVLADYAIIRAQLGDRADQLTCLFITTDPDRDTPAQLRAYLSGFDAPITGLTGTPDELARVYRLFGITVEKQPGAGVPGYLIEHTTRLNLINPSGELSETFPSGISRADILADLTSQIDR
jgi:protein SCO1/2